MIRLLSLLHDEKNKILSIDFGRNVGRRGDSLIVHHIETDALIFTNQRQSGKSDIVEVVRRLRISFLIFMTDPISRCQKTKS